MTTMNVDPDGVAASGRLIGLSGKQLSAEVARLVAELSGFGEPWGDDDIGSLIGLAYNEIRDLTFEVLAGNIDEMLEHADDVQEMAEAYRSTDETSAENLSAAGGD